MLYGSLYNLAYYVIGPGGGDGAGPVVGVAVGGGGARNALGRRKQSRQKTSLVESNYGVKKGTKPVSLSSIWNQYSSNTLRNRYKAVSYLLVCVVLMWEL